MKNKTLFVFNLDSAVDLITNSSSELFILEGNNQEMVMEVLDNTHENWRSEYEEPRQVTDLTEDELDTVHSWTVDNHRSYYWSTKKGGVFYSDFSNWGGGLSEVHVKDGELELPFSEAFENWENRTTPRPYQKHQEHPDIQLWESKALVKIQHQKLKELYPNSWFLFSFEDNPDWDAQEKLMNVGQRYHLG